MDNSDNYMRKIILTAICFFAVLIAFAQDSIRHRIILIGDAGEMDKQQQLLIPDAATHILSGKTTVLYLGDNIYPHGIGLPGSSDQSTTEQILRSQFEPMRRNGAAVYFIPGNHDWERSGKNGLARIKRQSEFLQEQGDSLLKLIPADGCPGPVALELGDSLTVIAFDSEWWLFPFNKTNPEAECECNSKKDILTKLEELFSRYRDNVILLASHHPFESYGTHGGYFSLKDHIFPLTAANKKLYIPLPVIGSLYPLLRKSFTNPEDLRHPLYKDMINRVNHSFAGVPNVMHVAGHEHGLQFIRNTKNKQWQIVSGGGAKENYTIKRKNSLFGKQVQGYVTADWLADNRMKYTFYQYQEGRMTEAFQYTTSYIAPPPTKADSLENVIKGDSMTVRLRPEYDAVGKLHRKLFGENYRKEFATPVTLPVIRLSEVSGGLVAEKTGGGMQTISLRLKDKKDREWALRSIEKNPDPLIPEALRQTFARDVLDDYMSAQHPFSPLVIPVLAKAAGVPHANPVIGIVAPDPGLGNFEKLFVGKVALLERREPLGKSDNTEKALKKLQEDNDNTYDPETFLRARLLDVLISDWDRHADQWRWADTLDGKGKYYLSVPRDRDQALYRKQGFFPHMASRPWILPTLQGFSKNIPHIKYSMIKSNFMNGFAAGQLTHEQWTSITQQFVAAVSDSVIDKAMKKLPASAYALHGPELAATMKVRRDNMPAAIDKFYRFIHKTVDIRGTDKNERVQLTGTSGGGLHVTVNKINKEGEIKDTLLSQTFDPSITKEIRLYLHNGKDSVLVDNSTSKIKLRIIGGNGDKVYNIAESRRKIKLYDKKHKAEFIGETSRLKKHLSNDSLNVAYVAANPYHVWMPLVSAGYNLDDGLVLGGGVKYTHQGFRKLPYASVHQLLVAHSFSTAAYRIRYSSEWLQALGKTDIVFRALARAPDNTQNYFGRGNETVYNKSGDFKRYYRARFALYSVDAGIRRRGSKKSVWSIGPSFQYYRYDADENDGRFISNPSLIGSYDSLTIDKNKYHGGLAMQWVNDTRNNPVFPAWGSYIATSVKGMIGLNSYAKSFVQVTQEIDLYKNLNARNSIILANRLGGSVSFGQTAFYQSQFLGGHENLLGYRQFRFAGRHMLYNNLELRIKLADFASYILPGQIGFTGFFDIGRVWETKENSGKWHNGTGGGIYFAPASLAVLQLVMGYSSEGWYPYFTMGFRF